MKKLKIVLEVFIITALIMGCAVTSEPDKWYIDKTYYVDETETTTLTFTTDGHMLWLEKVTYEFSTTEKGSDVVKFIWDETGKNISNYKIVKNEEVYELTGINPANEEKSKRTATIPLYFTEGVDGLQGKTVFHGIYNVYSKDDDQSQYIFYEDGTLEMINKMTYEMSADKITIGDTDYDYEMSEVDKTFKVTDQDGVVFWDLHE